MTAYRGKFPAFCQTNTPEKSCKKVRFVAQLVRMAVSRTADLPQHGTVGIEAIAVHLDSLFYQAAEFLVLPSQPITPVTFLDE